MSIQYKVTFLKYFSLLFGYTLKNRMLEDSSSLVIGYVNRFKQVREKGNICEFSTTKHLWFHINLYYYFVITGITKKEIISLKSHSKLTLHSEGLDLLIILLNSSNFHVHLWWNNNNSDNEYLKRNTLYFHETTVIL